MIKKDYLLINWKNGQKYDNIRCVLAPMMRR